MTDIQIFSNPQFGEIRTLADEANEPLFCAADVCKALGYTNPRKAVADHVDEGDVTKRDTPTTSGVQTMTFVNESGLNQQYVEMGLFEIKKGVRSGNDGVLHETKTPKITIKGQKYFINKFLNR